jgi:hypothetical protein
LSDSGLKREHRTQNDDVASPPSILTSSLPAVIVVHCSSSAAVLITDSYIIASRIYFSLWLKSEMMTFLLSAACLQVVLLVHAASVGAVPPLSHLLDDSYTFEAWMATHQKTYADEERVRRKGIFEDNLRHITEHNKKGDSGHVRGVNHLMDLESHELSMGYDKSFHEAWKGRGASDKDSWLKSHQVSHLQIRNITSETLCSKDFYFLSMRWTCRSTLTTSPRYQSR